MGNIQVNALHNAAVYIDGIGFVGQAQEVTVPRPKSKEAEYKGLGMFGALDLAVGMDKLKGKIKWSSFPPAAVQAAADILNPHQFQCRANLDQLVSGQIIAQLPVVYLMTARFADGGDDTLKHQELSEKVVSVNWWKSI